MLPSVLSKNYVVRMHPCRRATLIVALLSLAPLGLSGNSAYAQNGARTSHVTSVQTIDDNESAAAPRVVKQPQKSQKTASSHHPAKSTHGAHPQGQLAQTLRAYRTNAAHVKNVKTSPKEVGKAATTAAVVQNQHAPSKSNQKKTSLPPRKIFEGVHFASVRSNKVNLRAGPGQRFPITWVYFRRGLPVRVLQEFDVWRYVELPDKEKGWIQQTMLSPRRTFLIVGPAGKRASEGAKDMHAEDVKIKHSDSHVVGSIAHARVPSFARDHVVIHDKPSLQSRVIAILLPGTVGNIEQCDAGSAYCRVRVKQYDGWILRRDMWGLDPQESYKAS